MTNVITIQQGDQYAVPFPIYLFGERITPDNCDGVRIKIGSVLCEYPGTLEWDGDRQIWAFPLTEEMTRSWNMQKIRAQVGVKVDGECHLVREDGSVIGNLFGAGNMIYGGNLVSYYVPAHGVGTAIYSGDLAAQIAKTEIQAE